MKKSIKMRTLVLTLIMALAMAVCITAFAGCFGDDSDTPTVTSITLDTTAATKTFTVGDTFTSAGVKVTAKMSDDSEKSVALSECTVSAPNMSAAGTKTVTVIYSGKSATYDIVVNAAITVTSITLDTTAATKTFTVGDTFTSAGVKVTAKMSDDSEKSVALSECTVSAPNMSAAGTKTVTVTYSGKSATYDIVVNAAITVSSITLDTTAATKTFDIDDTFTAAGVTVKAKMSDDSEKSVDISECTVSNPDMSTTGMKIITVTYSGKSATYEITVEEAIDDTGTLQAFRFEAEDSDFGGGSVDTEKCGSEGSGYLKRADDSIDECVKNFFLGEGGYATFNITCNKRTHVTITMSIGTQGFSAKPDFDKYARLIINDVSTLTGIVYNSSVPTYGISPWWIFQDYQVTTEIVLKRGLNTVTVASYGYAGITLEEGDNAPQAGGKNLSWLEFSTTGTLSWAI